MIASIGLIYEWMHFIIINKCYMIYSILLFLYLFWLWASWISKFCINRKNTKEFKSKFKKVFRNKLNDQFFPLWLRVCFQRHSWICKTTKAKFKKKIVVLQWISILFIMQQNKPRTNTLLELSLSEIFLCIRSVHFNISC